MAPGHRHHPLAFPLGAPACPAPFLHVRGVGRQVAVWARLSVPQPESAPHPFLLLADTLSDGWIAARSAVTDTRPFGSHEDTAVNTCLLCLCGHVCMHRAADPGSGRKSVRVAWGTARLFPSVRHHVTCPQALC